MNSHSSPISLSTSTTSPPGDLASALIALHVTSFGRLILLDTPFPERADMAVPGRLMLESEVRRDDGPDVFAPVDEIGEAERAPLSVVADNSNPRVGIANHTPSIKSIKRYFSTYTQTSLYFISLVPLQVTVCMTG